MAYQFKVGDKVRRKYWDCRSAKCGNIYTVMECFCNDGMVIGSQTSCLKGCHCADSWELVVEEKLTNNQNNNMNKLKTLFKRLVDPEIQKLSEVGFLNGDLALTNEAKDELMNILFLEKKAELVKLANEILEERKKECK